MAKKKKISFRYLLRGKDDFKQLYIRINYDTKNTQIKCAWGDADIHWSEDDLESFLKREYTHNAVAATGNYLLEKEEIIARIVRYQEKKEEDFSIAGIGSLIEFYYTSLLDILRTNAEILFKKDIAQFMVAKDYLRVVEYGGLREMYLQAAIEYPRIKASLNEETITAIEAYIFYYLYVKLKEENNGDVNGTFFSWVIGDDKKNLPVFMNNISSKMKLAKRELSDFDFIEKFSPEKTKLEKYIQLIDLEYIRKKASF
ncbi:MAG: hypothetical protein H6559_24805 [Lewinellaceae bacterium]|nr:hypothetical protein [Lewinellaceae bacterium]